MEKAVKLKRRVKGAMVYPISIVGIAALVVTILLTKVIPVFEKMFKDFGGGKLPAPTPVVIDISHALAQFLPFIIAALIAAGIALRTMLQDAQGAAGLRRHAAEAAGARRRCCARSSWRASRAPWAR